jgi:exopolysaccharide biosynthesis polyprenyl glycosylphosphotransferase
VTTIELAEARVDSTVVPFPVVSTGRDRSGRDVARRALHDGRLRAVGIVAVAVAVVVAFGVDSGGAALTAASFAATWILAVHLVARSLRTVHVLAGHAGVSALGALGGLAAASALSLWVEPAPGHTYAELLAMTCGVLVVTYACEAAKARIGRLRSRVLIVGDGPSTRDVIDVLDEEQSTAFSVIGVVGDDANGMIAGVPMLGRLERLREVVEQHKPDLVVVSVDRGRPEVFAKLAETAGLGFRVVGVPEFYEHAFARVPVRNMTDAWFMSILHLYQRPYSRAAKRSFDIAVALLGLLLTAPLFIIVAALVRRTGPVFYRQTRLGDQGVPFTIFKFRTMRVDAEDGGAMWAQLGDPRTTGVGGLLRKLRLDELPQLINVLRGEMAIVGPRPERPEFVELLQESVPFWSRRHLLKPGITGWAQIRSGYAADSQATEQKLAYDLWYLRHQSLVVDLLICARTLPSLLLAAGR